MRQRCCPISIMFQTISDGIERTRRSQPVKSAIFKLTVTAALSSRAHVFVGNDIESRR